MSEDTDLVGRVNDTVDAFRRRARTWLEANAPRAVPHTSGGNNEGPLASIAEQKAFQAALYDAGFVGITWPPEYGGQGASSYGRNPMSGPRAIRRGET
jgi:alkylation response protein AidB-like acyl-CoA dehydrogenase